MEDKISVAVVAAVAEVEGVDPTDADFVLHEHINGAVLEALSDHRTASWRLSFSVADHEVTVTGDGGVYVGGERVNGWKPSDCRPELSA